MRATSYPRPLLYGFEADGEARRSQGRGAGCPGPAGAGKGRAGVVLASRDYAAQSTWFNRRDRVRSFRRPKTAFPSTCEVLGSDRVDHLMARKKVPRLLYKYLSLSGKNRLNAERLLHHNLLRFSRPDSFNDPCDILPILRTNADHDGWRRHFRSIVREHLPGLGVADREREVERLLRGNFPPTPSSLAAAEAEYKKRLGRLGVTCFSTRFDCLPMWAHYADNHRGLCLVVGTRLPEDVPAKFWEIKYRLRRPIVNIITNRDQANMLSVLRKGTDWKYEREWRLVLEARSRNQRFPIEVAMPVGFLKGVILGLKCTSEDKRAVRAWCRQAAGGPVRLYQAELDARLHRIRRKEPSAPRSVRRPA